MTTEEKPLLAGIWAVTWRSVVYLPLMLFAFILLLVLSMSLIALPVLGAAFIYYGPPLPGLLLLTVWLLLVWAWRRFNLARWYADPPSYL